MDARLGGVLLKKRIGTGTRGKSGGVRTIIAYRQGLRLIFLFGFSKNERANVDDHEKKVLQLLAEHYMKQSDVELNGLVAKEILLEVICGGEEEEQ